MRDEAVLVVFVVPCCVCCGAEGEHPHDTGAQPQAPHRHNVRILDEERLQILVVESFIVSGLSKQGSMPSRKPTSPLHG